jgi:hypothetical protein
MLHEKPTPATALRRHCSPAAKALDAFHYAQWRTAMSSRLSKVVGSLLLGLFAAAAQAVFLTPGSSAALPGTTSAADPDLAGVVLVDDLVPFSFAANGGNISGKVQVRVVRSALDSTLDFYWRVFNNVESSGVIGSFRIGDFATGIYDANWRIDGLGDVAPSSATRFAGAFDSFVNFNFGDRLTPGHSSKFLLLDTTATAYARNAIYDLTNFGQTQISGLFSMYGPTSHKVPEPSTLATIALALLAVAWVARRRPARVTR